MDTTHEPTDHPRLSFRYVPIETIKPYPQNPQGHNRHQTRTLAKVINKIGFNSPIIIDRHGTILAGHARLEAAKMAGLKEVPIVCIEDLTEAEAIAFRIADNKIALMATCDEELLAAELVKLSQIDVKFDVELTGYATAEIDLLIEQANAKYLRGGVPGSIEVEATESYGAITYEVRDNGRGIDTKDRERIFDLFRRSGVQDCPGDGIGLAHARALVRRLGGSIHVESELHHGTAFSVTLPKKWHQPASEITT